MKLNWIYWHQLKTCKRWLHFNSIWTKIERHNIDWATNMENNSGLLLHRFALFEFGRLCCATNCTTNCTTNCATNCTTKYTTNCATECTTMCTILYNKLYNNVYNRVYNQLYNKLYNTLFVFGRLCCATIGKVKHEKLLGKLAADTDCKHHYQIHTFWFKIHLSVLNKCGNYIRQHFVTSHIDMDC